MTCCSILHCGRNGNQNSFRKDGTTFLKFPKNPEIRAIWVQGTGRKDWTPTRHSVVCSLHFTKDCFYWKGMRRYLFDSAIPTLHLPKPMSPSEDQDPLRVSEPEALVSFQSELKSDKPIITVNNYEGSFCICCMSTEDLMDLYDTSMKKNGEASYVKMLAASLNIQLQPSECRDSICANCALRIKDCVEFKRQVFSTMVILSSVDLETVISTEDMKILGLKLNKRDEKDDTKPTAQSDGNAAAILDTETEERMEERLSEERIIKDKENKKEKTLKKVVISIPGTKKSGIPSQPRRPAGRPRVRPPDRMPYTISEQEFICRECGEEFLSNILLKAHYNVHFGKHACVICDKRFITWSSLRKHESTHQIGPFTCDYCGLEFHNRNSVRSHVRLKHRELPYPCRVCGARFPTALRRRSHLAEAHRQRERWAPCPRCPRVFTHCAQRDKHIVEFHEAWNNLRAPYLQAKIRRKKKTPVLEQPEKGRRRFACKLCGSDYKVKHNLVYHILAHARKGEVTGDPQRLVVDRNTRSRDTGLLSDTSSETNISDSDLDSPTFDIDEDKTKSDIEENNSIDMQEEYLDEEDGTLNENPGNNKVIFSDITFPSEFDECD